MTEALHGPTSAERKRGIRRIRLVGMGKGGAWALGIGVLTLAGLLFFNAVKSGTVPFRTAETAAAEASLVAADNGKNASRPRVRAPELDGGVAWLNTAGPIRLQDLRGKIVLLDFWTLCCINCLHTLPDLAQLEKKYANQLVIIGVHSAKFDNEKNSDSIRKAIVRYGVSHPVVNDANLKIWRTYGVRSWPTLVLIDPEGYYLGEVRGEGNYEVLDRAISRLIDRHRGDKTLNERPLRFELARFRDKEDSPLFFPGKVLADVTSNRLFIADSTHHRIVVTDLEGKKIAIAGSGEPGKADGPFDRATFNDPQGMALRDDLLYVADRKNHLIRALDLKARRVTTIAGSGEQNREARVRGGPALKVGLNSPWDLYLRGEVLFIAMAGHHQIWRLDLAKNLVAPYAGTGLENIRDGPLWGACFAQPSGLTSDGKTLYVADSEVSAIRAVPFDDREEVKTIVGCGLFEFGDVDGAGDKVRLQHALGVAFHEGKLYVADTYNSKIKVIDPAKRSCVTFLGEADGWLAGRLFNEPGGLSFAGDKLYVADTNGHGIRVVDMKTKRVTTLQLQGVQPPKQVIKAERPVFPHPVRDRLPQTTVPADGDLTLQVELQLPKGFKLNPEAKMTYLVETLPSPSPNLGEGGGGGGKPWSETKTLADVKTTFSVVVPIAKLRDSAGLRLSLLYYECGEGSEAICRIKSQIWDVPLRFDAKPHKRVIRLSGSSEKTEDKK